MLKSCEHELVLEALGGDLDAFGQLVRRYETGVCTFIHQRVRDTEMAKDLAQEVFLRAYRGLPRLRDPKAFHTWLFRIALNVTIDHRRLKAPKREPLERHGAELVCETEPFAPLLDAERRQLVEELYRKTLKRIREVPDRYREILYLRIVRGLSCRELAELFGVSLSSVKVRLFRGRELLRRCLERSSDAAELSRYLEERLD